MGETNRAIERYFDALYGDAKGVIEIRSIHPESGKVIPAFFNRVTDAVPTGRAFHAFMERTNRLKLYPLTHRIAEKGLPLVNDKGKHKINVQLSLIPNEDEQAADDGDGR